MIDEKYCREFNYLGDDIYLDVATVAMQPERTLAHCRSFQDELVRTRGSHCLDMGYSKERLKVMDRLTGLINCSSDEIVFTGSTTEGSSFLVNSIDFKPGENVITTAIEYPSVLLGWVQKQAKGASLKLVPTENGWFDEDELISMIDDKTRVVMLSLVHNRTGFMPDIKKIGIECRKRGVIFAVDAIQALGRVPVDVHDMCIDYLSSATYKGLLGVFGAAFVYCRRELQTVLKPQYYGIDNIKFEEGNGEGFTEFPVLEYCDGMKKMECGSLCTYAVLALGKSLEMLLEIGIENIREHVLLLERTFRVEAAKNMLPISFFGRPEEKYWSGNICFKYDSKKYEAVEAAFAKEKIYARVAPDNIRLAVHLYNTPEQLRKTALVLGEALR